MRLPCKRKSFISLPRCNATYILKGRFSDINADLTKSGKFHRYRHIGKMFRPRWAWTVFSYSYIGFTRACQAEFEQEHALSCACGKQLGQPKNRESKHEKLKISVFCNICSNTKRYL